MNGLAMPINRFKKRLFSITCRYKTKTNFIVNCSSTRLIFNYIFGHFSLLSFLLKKA
jgi:hypothetical protein